MSKVDYKTVFEPYPNPINRLLGTKIKSKSKVRIEENMVNASSSTSCIQPNTVFEPYSNSINSLQQVNNDSKLSQNCHSPTPPQPQPNPNTTKSWVRLGNH